MAEYIELDAIKRISFTDTVLINGKARTERIVLVRDIKKLPAADVAPVRHGKWMNANSRPKTYERRCTACGGRAYFCGMGCSYKYCPNCGAKMEEGAE